MFFRLDKKEHEKLKRLVKKSGLSQEAYIRHLINGVVPKEIPPPNYFAMMRELNRIGNNLNQISRKAHAFGMLDIVRYDENCKILKEILSAITRAVITPEPMEEKIYHLSKKKKTQKEIDREQ